MLQTDEDFANYDRENVLAALRVQFAEDFDVEKIKN